MPPFSKAVQLIHDLEPIAEAQTLSDSSDCSSNRSCSESLMREFLKREFCTGDLERIAPYLWIMTTFSSGNINPLHRQRVKGRQIIITEDPRLHLVWIHDRIFIKPLPHYLLSREFWKLHLDVGAGQQEEKSDLCKAATGFLRTYYYLVQHESDFHIAQQEDLRLLPKSIDWASFCRFRQDLNQIEDSTVSNRYHYGELRLTRLNFYAPFLLRKFHFEQVHGQYGDFFGRLYGPVLFVFATVSTILNSMQVALAAEQLVVVPWKSVWYISRYFSILSLTGAVAISTCFVLLWLWIFLDEWIFTIRRRREKKRDMRATSSC
jgi:hypothetical protein